MRSAIYSRAIALNAARKHVRLIVLVLNTLLISSAIGLYFDLRSPGAHAGSFGDGPLPIAHVAHQPMQLAGDELHIRGTIEGTAPVVVVLRVDDGQSTTYATRFNEERTFPPGPFEWRRPVQGLLTPSGRTLDANDIRKVILFKGDKKSRVIVERFGTVRAESMPAGAVGYALGAPNAALPAGFQRIAPGHPAIEMGKVTVVRRPGPDPMVANGLRGIERLRLPVPPGRHRITLWTEDPGEWEHLPIVLERRITINGRVVDQFKRSPSEWMMQRYLRGLNDEHTPNDDAWTAFGQRRGDVVEAEVDVDRDGVTIEMAGASPESTFLSAVLIEAAQSNAARQHVEAIRAAWYRTQWPVLRSIEPDYQQPTSTVLHLDRPAQSQSLPRIAAAPGTGARVTVFVHSDTHIAEPIAKVVASTPWSDTVHARIWAGQRRLQRRSAGDTVLVLSDLTLSSAITRFPIGPGAPRRYEIWLNVAETAAPGMWQGELAIGAMDAPLRVPFSIEVLPVALAEAAKPAGFYLDEAPHISAVGSGTADRSRQIACDLALMQSFGLTGSAPAMATPLDANSPLVSDLEAAMAGNVAPPFLAYAPAKRLLHRFSASEAAMRIAAIDAERRRLRLPTVIWSVADEPSNPSAHALELSALTRALREIAPNTRVAGHLNAREDMQRLPHYDVAIINAGFGLDLSTIARAHRGDKKIWLYNTENPRLTAGLWLWRSAAQRYVQWHARMPTADPLDPTDGREGDVQMILPSYEACPQQQVIHADVLEMAEGIVDQRWLQWLAEHSGAKSDLSLVLPVRLAALTTWGQAQQLRPRDLQSLRESIMKLVRPQL